MEDLKRSVPVCEFRRIRILLSLSGDIIYYFCERREGEGGRAYEMEHTSGGNTIVSGDNLHRRRIRTKLAESFVFFQSRKFGGNYFGLISRILRGSTRVKFSFCNIPGLVFVSILGNVNTWVKGESDFV